MKPVRLPMVRDASRRGPAPTRRELLQWLGALAAASALPSACSSPASPGSTSFFSPPERRALGALADVVIPPDQDPGGSQLGAVEYIERLLTAFDGPSGSVPPIFAGGPYSGRTPFSDDQGGASTDFPDNEFAVFLPLDRVNERAWRLYLYGSSGVPGGGPNDAVLGPIVGLRDQVKSALLSAMSNAPAPIETLSPADAASVFSGLTPDLRDLLIELVCEAAFAPPEYGGNVNLAGWKICNFEGDIQPLGYSVYDEGAGTYRERPEAPMSTPNQGPDPAPLTDDTKQFISEVVSVEGGKVFS